MSEYYVTVLGNETGPYSLEELERMTHAGVIGRGALVRCPTGEVLAVDRLVLTPEPPPTVVTGNSDATAALRRCLLTIGWLIISPGIAWFGVQAFDWLLSAIIPAVFSVVAILILLWEGDSSIKRSRVPTVLFIRIIVGCLFIVHCGAIGNAATTSYNLGCSGAIVLGDFLTYRYSKSDL